MPQILQPKKYYSGFPYPAGATPGFDPSHIAAAQTRFSAVCYGANFISLLNASTGVVTASPTTSLIGLIGRVTIFTATAVLSFSNQSTNNDATATFAAILVPNNNFASQTIFSTSNNGTTGIDFGVASDKARISSGGVAGSGSVAITSGIPIFLAANFNNGTVNFVIANLATGIIRTDTSSGSGGPTAPNGTYLIGNGSGGTTPQQTGIAAVMFSARYMPTYQLLQWAANPWSFWYQ